MSRPRNDAKRIKPLSRCLASFGVVSRPILTLIISIATGFFCFAVSGDDRQSRTIETATVTVSYTPGHPANTFTPSEALGAGVDGHEKGEVDRMLSPRNIREMLSAGLKPLTYRLRTELAGEVWHWNPTGRWSDEKNREGYWTSSSLAGAPISLSYGYRLPRRGNTIDQANNDGYSRLDDNDLNTFWKSDPYLDGFYTKESDQAHPQWIVIDMGAKRAVNALCIVWGEPFAKQYRIEYASVTDNTSFYDQNIWHTFEHGTVTEGAGGSVTLRISDEPLLVRFVRIVMTESSHTPRASSDVRDRLGYAVREVGLGSLDDAGRFQDQIQHAASHDNQTVIYVSSTDPWHRAVDIDPKVEQPGVDRVFRSGLTNNLPAMIPVGIVYDTPDNAASLLRYLKSRRYKVEEIEVGEEADGQYVSPEDYGALYAQWMKALRPVDSTLQFGGPSFATITPFLDESREFSEKTWLRRFLSYLKGHDLTDAFKFFTFEWYPFDDVCSPHAEQLAAAPEMLKDAMEGLRREILPAGARIYITEYGYSAYADEAEDEIEGALLNADVVGLFLTLGGERAYLYGYEPNEVTSDRPCTWGNNMLFGLGASGGIKFRTATYYGARLLTRSWAGPSGARLELFPASSDVNDLEGNSLITAYALRLPEGRWSLMIINKDPRKAFDVNVKIKNAETGESLPLKLPADLFQFSSEQYIWKADGAESHPTRSLPPAHRLLSPYEGAKIRLPPYSLTVVRER
ncbi:MAG: discoidin domain-containing protein [Acidobacteriota bacterium]|nr:discoidin domain-containing protein [Acidobacteriota bacterium]